MQHNGPPHSIQQRRNTLLACALLIATACDPQGGGDEPTSRVWLEFDDAEPAYNEGEFDESDNPIITRVTVEDDAESFVDFLDEPTGAVGLVASGRAVPHMIHLADDEHASALEVFLALAPDEAVPQRLSADHRELADAGRVPQEPRRFEAFREIDDDEEMCSYLTPAAWEDYWEDWHAGYGSAEAHGDYEADNFYVVTETTNERALGICFTVNDAVWTLQPTASMNLQFFTGSYWLIFYTQNLIHKGYGVAYRSSSPALGWYRERAWTTGASAGDDLWFSWGGAY